MITIKLKNDWELEDQIASGGFAKIYNAKGSAGNSVVIKLVPKAPGASRELLFEELAGLPNILPIIETGEWDTYYVLVMPFAQKSLRQYLQESSGKLTLDNSISILIEITTALSSLNNGIVHRDLKPENILLYQDHWCLADFGIARYAEATTAPNTHKYSMTPPYAAPEQWRSERATAATDIYALGVIAFEMIQGVRPFPGPDFREQHLNNTPPAVTNCPPYLSSLITECLYKPAAARPTPANILARLQKNKKPTASAMDILQSANQAIVEKMSHQAAIDSAKKSEEEQRAEMFKTSELSIKQIIKILQDDILSSASAAKLISTDILSMQLGQGKLSVFPVTQAPKGCLAMSGELAPFDVISYTYIAVQKPKDHYEYEGRSHSLWFCDAYDEGVYRWFELSFMIHPLMGGPRSTMDPFALTPTNLLAGQSFSGIMGTRQLAWQPTPLDQGEEQQFIKRWIKLFAAASSGQLSHPGSLPENSNGRFRRAKS